MDGTRQSSFRQNFHVCIVGAGIVGLAGAILFHRYGFHVTMIERDSDITTIGAGIQLHPNAMRVLNDLGVGRKIKERSIFPDALILKAYNTGKVLHSQDLKVNESLYGESLVTIHRGHLREILYTEVKARDIQVRHGIAVDVKSVDLANGILNLPGSPETVRADLFIGADGSQSVIRQALVGRQEMLPHGKAVHRMLIDEEKILESPRLRYLLDHPSCVVWLGPESQAVTYGLDGRFNIAFSWPWSTNPEDAFLQGQKVNLNDFRSGLSLWEPDLRELVGLAKDCMRWMLFEQRSNDESAPWVSEKGNFCLVGDAAHSLLPYLAQGAAMGLESISILAHLLDRTKNREQVQQCLQIYQRVRKERIEHVARANIKNGRNMQMADGFLKEERDRELMYDTPTAGFPNLLADPFFQKWLWGFDAKEEVERIWLANQTGK